MSTTVPVAYDDEREIFTATHAQVAKFYKWRSQEQRCWRGRDPYPGADIRPDVEPEVCDFCEFDASRGYPPDGIVLCERSAWGDAMDVAGLPQHAVHVPDGFDVAAALAAAVPWWLRDEVEHVPVCEVMTTTADMLVGAGVEASAQDAEYGNEPVRGPGGTGDLHHADLLDHGDGDHDPQHAAVPEGHHRIDWDTWTPHVPKVVHKVFLELPLPPSEVWTDHEWTFWPMRSVPHYDLAAWEQIARSVLDSVLMSVGLKFLNEWEEAGRIEFLDDDVLVVKKYLIEWATTAKPSYKDFWWDEAVVVGQPGMQSLKEAKKHFAGRRLPIGLLRASAARTAHSLLIQADQPHRVETVAERAAWRAWLKKPYGPPPLRQAAVPTTYDMEYLSLRGCFPPIWRPKKVALAERQSMLGKKSGEVRQPDRSVLLSLPVGLTVPETVAALDGLGISVTTKTVTNWRRRLLETGVVKVGHEPWRTAKGRPKRAV